MIVLYGRISLFFVQLDFFIIHQWILLSVSSVQFSCSVVSDSATPWITARQASLFITNSQSLLKRVHRVGDAIQPSHPLLSPSPPLNPSQHEGLFQWVTSTHQVAKDLEFQLQHQSFQKTPRTDHLCWISLQSKGLSRVFSNTTVQKHQFFCAQLSSQSNSHIHTWPLTGKTIALTRGTFVGKVMSMLFNMLSRFVITFLPRSTCLLISWLQSPSAVILEPPKIKSDPVCTVSPSISHEVMGPDTMILVFWMLSFKLTFSLSSFTFITLLQLLLFSQA